MGCRLRIPQGWLWLLRRAAEGRTLTVCGIIGGIAAKESLGITRSFLVAGADLMRHRGPDDEGIETGKGWGLGFRRLSILDLSSSGRQPMSDHRGECWLVFNGEIYNFRELRKELEGAGVRFDSTGDAQVLLYALREWGAGALSKLNGMFAFAFLDLRRDTLLLARDRLGQKPLLYHRDAGRLLFASEPAPLLRAPGMTVEPDLLAVNQYLCFNYIPAPRTVFRGIRKLLPGHVLEVPLRGPYTAEPRPYWELRFDPVANRSTMEWVEETETVLTDAVKKRLVSDVPVGSFLSGGLDSSLVTSLASREASEPLTAFTVGFREEEWDESSVAGRTARHCAIEHRVQVLEPDAWTVLPDLVRHYQEPFADSSAVPTYYLCGAASEHGKVFLSGDGGDEAFGGYRRYWVARRLRWLEPVPLSIRRALSAGLTRLIPEEHPYHRHAVKLGLPDGERYAAQTVLPQDPLNLLPLAPEARRSDEEIAGFLRTILDEARGLPPVSLMQYVDYRIYLSNDILVKVDRASMAHSLEVRSPFLDHRIAELASRIPQEAHRDGGRGKRLLRTIAGRHLPPEVLGHRKQGFGLPLPQWFAGSTLDRIRDVFYSRAARERGIYDPSGIDRLLTWQARDGGRDLSHALWRLLFLEEWFRQFVDRPPPGFTTPTAAS